MDTLRKNRELIVNYFKAISGEKKTEALLRKFMTDEKLVAHIAFFEGSFPKYELFIEEMVSENNKVIVLGRALGVHELEFNGIPPTHKEMNLPFVIRYTIENGKIIDHWLIADQMVLMEQLGVIDANKEQPV